MPEPPEHNSTACNDTVNFQCFYVHQSLLGGQGLAMVFLSLLLLGNSSLPSGRARAFPATSTRHL